MHHKWRSTLYDFQSACTVAEYAVRVDGAVGVVEFLPAATDVVAEKYLMIRAVAHSWGDVLLLLHVSCALCGVVLMASVGYWPFSAYLSCFHWSFAMFLMRTCCDPFCLCQT